MIQIDAPATSSPHDKEVIPRVMVMAMGGLVLVILALVALARLSGVPVVATPPTSNVQAEHQIILSGNLSGSATVHTIEGVLVADLSPQEGGFISGVWRVIHRERTKHRVAMDGPVTLRRHDTGRISIYDPATGWGADLMGFGADNARAFTRLLAQLEGGQ